MELNRPTFPATIADVRAWSHRNNAAETINSSGLCVRRCCGHGPGCFGGRLATVGWAARGRDVARAETAGCLARWKAAACLEQARRRRLWRRFRGRWPGAGHGPTDG